MIDFFVWTNSEGIQNSTYFSCVVRLEITNFMSNSYAIGLLSTNIYTHRVKILKNEKYLVCFVQSFLILWTSN